MANCSYTGNVKAAERWESFTTDGGADAFYNETVAAQVANPDGTATLTLASPVLVSEFYYEWARGNAVTVVQGPSVGQVRRLVDVIAPDNTTIVISAPFDPPLSPTDDIVAITSYRGGFTFEGNRYLNGTCFQFCASEGKGWARRVCRPHNTRRALASPCVSLGPLDPPPP